MDCEFISAVALSILHIVKRLIRFSTSGLFDNPSLRLVTGRVLCTLWSVKRGYQCRMKSTKLLKYILTILTNAAAAHAVQDTTQTLIVIVNFSSTKWKVIKEEKRDFFHIFFSSLRSTVCLMTFSCSKNIMKIYSSNRLWSVRYSRSSLFSWISNKQKTENMKWKLSVHNFFLFCFVFFSFFPFFSLILIPLSDDVRLHSLRRRRPDTSLNWLNSICMIISF